jgi:hypothetical protein
VGRTFPLLLFGLRSPMIEMTGVSTDGKRALFSTQNRHERVLLPSHILTSSFHNDFSVIYQIDVVVGL